MSFKLENDDLRCLKTEKSIHESLLSLLEQQNFRKITVRDICGQALISRATFYAHYNDKYDLLEQLLAQLAPTNLHEYNCYEKIEKTVNQMIQDNQNRVKNIVSDADEATWNIVFDFMLSLLNLPPERGLGGISELPSIVVSHILAGGLICYLLWHVKHKFPSAVMNIYLYELIEKFREHRE